MVLDKIPTFEEVKNWVNGDISPDTVNAGTVNADALEATAELGNPTNLPEGTQVYVADENQLYVEDGT